MDTPCAPRQPNRNPDPARVVEYRVRIVVTGGTGRLGSAVVERLAANGHEAVVVSRTAGEGRIVADLATGEGLGDALSGADAIIHAASDATGDASVTDVAGTQTLARSGLPVLYVSIVGVDRHPLGYYRTKHEGEITLAENSEDWTVLRATQFHSFLDELLTQSKRATGGRIPVLGRSSNAPFVVPRGFLVQPVSHVEVADRIVALVEAGPTRTVEQFAGPDRWDSVELARSWARARGGRAVGVPTVGGVSRAYRRGRALPPIGTELGHQGWTDYLRASAATD